MGAILFSDEIKYQEYVCHTKDAQQIFANGCWAQCERLIR